MPGAEGEQSGVQYDQMDSMDQASMDGATSDMAMGMVTAPFNKDAPDIAESQHQMQQIRDRAAKKAELAEATQANTRMVVDPEQVDGLASFFEDKAEELHGRILKVQELGMVEAPGADPTSIQVAEIFSKVGAGEGQGYLENYMKLIDLFKDTAQNLRASAKQTRTDEQSNEDALRGGDLA